jgi:hypothetical protein
MLKSVPNAIKSGRWTDCLYSDKAQGKPNRPPLIGVLPGEGIGPEIVNAALDVLNALSKRTNVAIEVLNDACIGRDAERAFGTSLPENVVEFCAGIFSRGGAVLHGPGGGRFVYELRRRLDLFFKITPLQSIHALPHFYLHTELPRKFRWYLPRDVGRRDNTIRPKNCVASLYLFRGSSKPFLGGFCAPCENASRRPNRCMEKVRPTVSQQPLGRLRRKSGQGPRRAAKHRRLRFNGL